MRWTLTTALVALAVIGVPIASGTAVNQPSLDAEGTATAGPIQAERGSAQVDNGTDRPGSASEYLSAFRAMNGTAAFANYSELEVARSQAVSAVQVGNFTRAERQRLDLVLSLLETFRAGYRHQQNGSYAAAIEAANETSEIGDRLRETDGGERYALLAEVALERFYDRTGQALQARAEQQSSTPARIDTLRLAALTYQRSGSTQRYSQVLVRVDSVEGTFEADRRELNESAAAARAFTRNCRGCDSAAGAVGEYGLGVFPQYQRALAATSEADHAARLTNKHGLSDRSERVATLREEVADARSTLALASLAVVLGYASVVGLLASLVGGRLLTWRRDLESATSGDSVLLGVMLDE